MERWRRKMRAGGGPDWRLGAGEAAGRTMNMERMDMTLDVSKLSGWLNAVALCRVEREACEAARGAGWEADGQWSGGGARCVQGRARPEIGRRAGAERTENMAPMDVTSDVSKLNG